MAVARRAARTARSMSASDMLGGLPARVYCDNGAIYGSRQFGRIMAELGIPLRGRRAWW